MLRATSIGLAVLLAAALTAAAPLFTPPDYKQCDSRWGHETIAGSATICQKGCAMSNLAMALAGFGVTLDGHLVNPGSLNTWLKANHGYICEQGDCTNLNLTATEQLSPKLNLIGEMPKPEYRDLVNSVASLNKMIYIAHVRRNSHFVLLLTPTFNEQAKSFNVLDPLDNTTEYGYDDITHVIMYKYDKYPVYKQCDSRWGSIQMGSNHDTICQVGCLMSSTAMGMAGNNIKIGQQPSDPQTLNAFLQAHHGYVPGTSAMDESVVPQVAPHNITWPSDGMHPHNDIPIATIQNYITRLFPRIVIANVNQGHHFVLVVGYRSDNDTLVVNDPGFNRNTYSYRSDVVGWRLFDMH